MSAVEIRKGALWARLRPVGAPSRWLFGVFTWGIGPFQIGDPEGVETLLVYEPELYSVLADRNHREHPALCTADRDAVFDFVTGVCRDRISLEDVPEAFRSVDIPGRHYLRLTLDAYRDWTLVLFQCGETDILMVERVSTSERRVFALPRGSVDALLLATARQIEAWRAPFSAP
ncbi:MAG: hypothetical protein AAFR44_13915 [Pseudomonadota bacterium]